MMLLPVVFMVHEYEEIMMFRRWIDRNREELRKRSGQLKVEEAAFDAAFFNHFMEQVVKFFVRIRDGDGQLAHGAAVAIQMALDGETSSVVYAKHFVHAVPHLVAAIL